MFTIFGGQISSPLVAGGVVVCVCLMLLLLVAFLFCLKYKHSLMS
jgi:hypothetical protein